MMTRRTLRSLTLPARRAFTLVELLVVITIIAILVALTATAVFGVRRNMQQTNAEATLQKIDQKLLKKLKDMDGQITDDLKKGGADHPEVTTVMSACGGNKDVAKAVMMYARTRRDMPMTFAEARNNFTVCGHIYRASPAFANLPMSGTASIEESAACLYAIIAPMGLDGLENQVGVTSTGQKCFTDGMNQPIGFVRLGYDGNAGELNKYAFDPFYPNKNAQTGVFRDLSADFGATFNAQVWLQVRQPAVPWLPAPGAYVARKYHTAFCFSAGLNDDFDTTGGIYNGDNLFSYRLRKEGASGD